MESLTHPVLLRANQSLVFAVVGIVIAWLGIGCIWAFEADLLLLLPVVGPFITVCGFLALAKIPIDGRFRLLMIGTIASVVAAWVLFVLVSLGDSTPYHRFLAICFFLGLNWLGGLIFCRAMLHLAHSRQLLQQSYQVPLLV